MKIENAPFEVQILGTGSTGNAVLIDDCILLDCGLGVKKLMPYLTNVRHLFITHRHGDHLNLAVLKNIAKKISPSIIRHGLHVNSDCYQLICDKEPELAEMIETERLTTSSYLEFEVKGTKYEVTTYPLYHDVENQGFVIKKNGKTLIHATDTSTMRDAPKGQYDIILVEGNYDESKLIEYLQSDDRETRYRAARNLRHLSIQAHENFVKSHSHSETISVMLHESYDFGLGMTDDLKSEISKIYE